MEGIGWRAAPAAVPCAACKGAERVPASTSCLPACPLTCPPCPPLPADKQREMEEADWLLNAVAAGEAGWDEVRGEVGERYAAAGLTTVADFIRAA